MSTTEHAGWTIAIGQNHAAAVRAKGQARVGLARKRGESDETLHTRLCNLVDNYENAITSNEFLRAEVEKPKEGTP